MDDDDVVVHLRKEKEERKANVLKELEIPKSRFLLAIENQGFKNPQNRTNLEAGLGMLKTAQILEKNGYYSFSHYLRCAKAISNMFCEVPNNCSLLGVKDVFTYILTHARLFGDQSLSMFPLECKGKIKPAKPPTLSAYPSCPISEYMEKITALIEDLKLHYDETKYRILNANMTYITLLILRRHVQTGWQYSNSFQHDNTQKDYHKLCPLPFSCKLPRMNLLVNKHLRNEALLEPVSLAIHAFLTVEDDLTKNILHKTCIQCFEWDRMELPSLFFKVVSLYGIPEARLWDLLSSEKTFDSLHRLANVFNTDIGPEIFPYGMVLNNVLHVNCMGNSNVYLCTILAHIVDIKIGFDKSFIRNSDWADDKAANKAGMKIAKLFQQFYSQ